MRRLVAVLALLAALVSFGPRPAAAHTDTCVGHGTMVTAGPVYYPFIGPVASTPFAMVMTVGTCLTSATYSMSGTLTGHCLSMTGAGATDTGHTFAFVVTGTTMFVNGEVFGTGDIQADALFGHSCVTGAKQFRVSGAHLLLHPGGGTPPPNSPPNTPTLVAPADGAAFTTTDVPVFTINATDPDGDSYIGTIEVQEVGSTTTQVMTTAPASSGSKAGTTTGNLPPGTYQWRARAGDFSASSGWSGSNTFTVTLT